MASSDTPPRENTVEERRLPKTCCWIVLLACCGIIVLEICNQFFRGDIWDDSFMFIRYADNVLAHGKLSWNPGGEPTYGLTSPLFLAIVVPLRFFFADNPVVTALSSSLICGVLFLILIVMLLVRYVDAEPVAKRSLLLVIGFSLVVGNSINPLAAHFTSGMDTAFALAFLAAYFFIAKWHERSASGASIILMGVWGGLAFSARPDLLLYSFVVPASIIVFASDRKAKRNALIVLCITAVVAAGQTWLASWYFDSPLPLSFFAKGSKLYGDFIYKKYADTPVNEFLAYVSLYWYLFLIIGGNFVIYFKGWRQETSAIDKGLIVATGLFILYYLFFVLQIMHYNQRFYFPTLAALVFLAFQGGARIIKKPPEWNAANLSKPVVLLATFLLLGFLLPRYLQVSRDIRTSLLTGDYTRFNIMENYWNRYRDTWFCLDDFSLLPDDLVIATTEVGLPAAMNPKKTIVDLTGLNETEFARRGFSADFLFRKYRPDLIYMPHPDYRETVEELRENPYFVGHYEYFPLPGKLSDVAIRRESKYYADMRTILTHRIAE